VGSSVGDPVGSSVGAAVGSCGIQGISMIRTMEPRWVFFKEGPTAVG
jgi:hypothetical protein